MKNSSYKISVLAILGAFLPLMVFGWYSSYSSLINKKTPIFNAMDLYNPDREFNNQIFLGHVSLLNVFATWREACATEHPILVNIANSQQVMIYGLDYKDDRHSAREWLKNMNNPYQIVGFDKGGEIASKWGVYDVPETFVIDKHGIIRYKQIGPITQKIWQGKLLPLVEKLEKQG